MSVWVFLALVGRYLTQERLYDAFADHPKEQWKHEYALSVLRERFEILAENGAYQCPCCLRCQEGDGCYDICDNCSWECEGWDLDLEGGPNHMTLREGRANYAKHGTSDAFCSHGIRERGCELCLLSYSQEQAEDEAEEHGY